MREVAKHSCVEEIHLCEIDQVCHTFSSVNSKSDMHESFPEGLPTLRIMHQPIIANAVCYR